jgi:hypothetical protein
MFARTVSREILDELAPNDPRALRSRRDLLRVNRIMGTPGILARAMLPSGGSRSGSGSMRVLELGAGDGRLMLGIARAVAQSWPPIELTLLDRQPLVEAATCATFAGLGWSARPQIMDVMDWVSAPAMSEAYPPWDLIVTNLFLHHFDEQQLPVLLSAIAARCNAFLACEPRRALLALAGSHLMAVIGASRVTRHDAVLSVRAGFRGHELASIWPRDRDEWQLHERKAGLFSHLFHATRTGIPTVSIA